MNLYDIIACPICKQSLVRQEDSLLCSQCQRRYPIINNVPILFPDGRLPTIQHEGELAIRNGYNPWVERLVMQSLPPSAIVLDLGAGNMAFNLPHVIRMDVTLTPYVDVVGDAHALPFLPDTFDFIFSLAVIEHLRQPFVAAQEMYRALRNGGYVYGECNFVFPYHGYPHHYFGMTQQGIEEVFQDFMRLRSSVATYQMPSFAIRFVLESYKQGIGIGNEPAFQELLQAVLDHPLSSYDRHFSEAEALRVAAGVFYFGVKAPEGKSDVIPEVIQSAWRNSPTLQARFPNQLNLGVKDNLMQWAKREGRANDPDIATYFATATPFMKSEMVTDDLAIFESLPIEEASFGFIVDTQRNPSLSEPFSTLKVALSSKERELLDREQEIRAKNQHIAMLETLIQQIESGRVMRLLRLLSRRKRS